MNKKPNTILKIPKAVKVAAKDCEMYKKKMIQKNINILICFFIHSFKES